ncbi:MAG: Swt1 family HEPN domain-containing protein [Gaiellaceae bacterium]
MAVNRQLREDLLKKLGVGWRRLNQLAAQRAAELPASHEEAIYTLAYEHGLTLSKYLTREEVAEIRALVAQSPRPAPTPAAPAVVARARNGPSPQRSGEIALNKIRIPGGVLSDRHRRDAEQMATKVYPLLYAFENSAREFIDGHLTAAYGENWYDDPKIVSTEVRATVERNRRADSENRTHRARNARPIYYTTFGELVLIVQSEKGCKVFKRPLFPRPTWFPELVKPSEHTRNIVAHMNPIKPHDLRRLEVDFEDWLNQIKGHLRPTVPS